MKRSAYLLVSLFTLATHAMGAEESAPAEDTVALNDEVAALHRRSKPLNVKMGADDRVNVLEQQMSEVYTDTVRDTFGAKVASARPQLDSYGVYLSGDALYWKGFEGGSDYVSVMNPTSVPAIGKSEHLDFQWKWGFRVELGYRLPHDQWDLAAHYTWFFDNSSNDASAPEGGGLTPLLYIPYTTSASTAKGSWKFHYNDFDLSLEKSFFLSRSFALTPVAALRTTLIDQNLQASYIDPAGESTFVNVYGKNNFWGIGPKAGLASRWFMGPHWNLFAKATGSLLYSEFNVRATGVVNDVTTINLKGDLHRIVPTVDGAIGLGWEMNFLSNHYHIAINVSYEAQYWWRQNELFSFADETATPLIKRFGEDLGLHGLTINALFDF